MIGGLARKSSFYALVIMIWEVASRVGVWPKFLFPAPSEVLQTRLQGFADRTFIFGSLASLRDVVRHYSEINPDRLHADGQRLLKPLHLSASEIDDLVAFLESLTPANAPAGAR